MSDEIKKNNIYSKSRYRPEIDGLRAFAVVAVIINHFNKEILPNGYLGVDIFFVISGFVITSSLYQRPSKDFKDFISGFYARRIKRLVPALSLFVLITSVAICLFNPSPEKSLITGLTSLFGLSNLYLLKQSIDYFASSTELNVFTHTWSLGVEEQFYIFFPFLIWFSGFGRQTKNGVRNLFLIIGALTIGSLIGFLYLYSIKQSVAYFFMPLRFWEMASGCLLFIGLQKWKSIEQFLGKVPPLLVLGLIIGVMYLPMSLATTSTIAVVILSSILIASLKKRTRAYKIFTNPKVIYIGLISYSLYLWHWGVLSISRWTIGIYWWSVPFQFALIFGLAIASYRYIETPLRKGNWFGKRWKTLASGTGVLVVTSLPITSFTLNPSLSKAIYTGDLGYFSVTNHDQPPNQFFIRQPKNVNESMLIIGDSHAGHLYTMIKESDYLSSKGLFLHVRGKGLDTNPKAGNFFYDEFTKATLEHYKKRDTKLKWVVFSVDGRYENVRASVRRSIDYLLESQKREKFKLILVSQSPLLEYSQIDFRLCEKTWFRPNYDHTKCLASEKEKKVREKSSKLNNYYYTLSKNNSEIEIFDPIPSFCNSGICKNTDNEGRRLFSDADHFTKVGSRKLIERFDDFMKSLNKKLPKQVPLTFVE